MVKINKPCGAHPEQEAKGVAAVHALRLLLRACHGILAELIRNIADRVALWKSGEGANRLDFTFRFGVRAQNLV